MGLVVEYFPQSNYVWMIHSEDTIKHKIISYMTVQRTCNRATDKLREACSTKIFSGSMTYATIDHDIAKTVYC